MNHFTRTAALAVAGAALNLPALAQVVKVRMHVPLSGETPEFDAAGKCTAGCSS